MLPARVQPKPVPRNRVKVGKTPGLAYPHFRVCGLLVGHFCPTNSPARVRPRFYCFFSKSTGETPSTFMSIPRVRGKSELRLKTCQNRILYHLCAWKNSQGHFALEFGRLDSIWAAFLTSPSIPIGQKCPIVLTYPCVYGGGVIPCFGESFLLNVPPRVWLMHQISVSGQNRNDCFPPCVALTSPRKFAPFPVRMFFRGDSRQVAALIQYNTIQYSAPASPKQHYILSLRVCSIIRYLSHNSAVLRDKYHWQGKPHKPYQNILAIILFKRSTMSNNEIV